MVSLTTFRKQTDEASPNIFTYSISLLNNQFASGKIEPRKVPVNWFSSPKRSSKSSRRPRTRKELRKRWRKRKNLNKSILSRSEEESSGRPFQKRNNFIELRKIPTKHSVCNFLKIPKSRNWASSLSRTLKMLLVMGASRLFLLANLKEGRKRSQSWKKLSQRV